VLKISSKREKLAFSILIGGKSKRFGSDKGLYQYKDKPLISHQLEILTHFNCDIFVIGHSQNQIRDYVKKIDYRKIIAFILDEKIIKNSIRSPLIGLYSAFKELNKLNYDYVFALSCDMPFIQEDVVELMIQNIDNYDCCIPRWSENGFLEPLFAIYPVDKGLKKARENLDEKVFKLTNLIDTSWKVNYIPIEEKIKKVDENLCSFYNINKPEDLDDIKVKCME
jgi:molybdopterin-guanine dinucleotide biosynthesis protein A